MANNAASLAEKLSRAKMVMDVTATPQFNKYAKEMVQGGFVDNFASDSPLLESTPQLTQSSPHLTKGFNTSVIPPNIERRSGLPKAILESMTKQPLDVSEDVSYDPNIEALMSKVANSTSMQNTKPKFSQMETIQPTQNVIGGSSVDYSIIKTITEDIMKRYLGAFKKQLLKETKLLQESSETPLIKGIKLTDNKFQFIDSDGNMYEAAMIYKGNIKEKKIIK